MLSFFCVIGSLVILPFGKQGVCSSQAGFHVRLGRSDMIRCKCLGRPTTTPTEAKFVFCGELEAKIPNRTSKSTSARDSETQSNKANTCNKPHTKIIYIYFKKNMSGKQPLQVMLSAPTTHQSHVRLQLNRVHDEMFPLLMARLFVANFLSPVTRGNSPQACCQDLFLDQVDSTSTC